MSDNPERDVVIMGGGPAGTTAAALLAEKGRRVRVLEREKFPRYHVGESLLPFAFYPLQRLGLIEKMRASAFVKKYSVQFISASGKASQPFYFFNRYGPDVAQTWQVLRSEFDQMLMQHARGRGATVEEEVTVTDLLQASRRATGRRARHRDGRVGEYFAPITLDCSANEAFAAVRNHWRVRAPKLNKVAVWTYFQGAKREAGMDAGATTGGFVSE